MDAAAWHDIAPYIPYLVSAILGASSISFYLVARQGWKSQHYRATTHTATFLSALCGILFFWHLGVFPLHNKGEGAGNHSDIATYFTGLVALVVTVLLALVSRQHEQTRQLLDQQSQNEHRLQWVLARIQRTAELTNTLLLSDDESQKRVVLPYILYLYSYPASVHKPDQLAIDVFIRRRELRDWLTEEDWRYVRYLASSFEHDIAAVRDEVRRLAGQLYGMKPR